jgi:hypothetical protein
MNCLRAERLFSNCWDDELSVAERDALQSHFAACAHCRAAYDEFSVVMQAVHGLPRLTASPEFTDQVLARARAAEAERQPSRTVSRTWTWGFEWRWQPALAAAAALVVVAGGVWVGVMRPGLPDPAPQQLAARSDGSVPAPAPAMAPQSRALAADEAQTPAVGSAERSEGAVGKEEKSDEAPQALLGKEQMAAAPAPPAEALALSAKSGAPAGARAKVAQQEIPDSLFDHAYDVEFAFEPVNLRRVGDSKVAPARPMPTSEVGRPAKITF